ncbi:MAG: PAS domain S-box protein [Micromonosporaceae bacterium]
MTGEQRELAEARDALRQREAELAASAEHIAGLHRELEETNLGLIALHAELEDAREAAARLAAIVQWSDDALFSLTLDGTIQTWNPGAERLFVHSPAEIVNRSAKMVVPTGLADEFDAVLKRVRAGDQAEAYDTQLRRKDGSLVDVAVTISAMRDTGGAVTGFSVVVRDVTDRLRAEAELAAARAEQEVLAERDRMARDLHDRVIQRIFAAGMALQSTASVASQPEVSARIDAIIGELDISIEEIREAIFTLRRERRKPVSLPAQVLLLVSETTAALGFAPDVSLDGPVSDVPDDVCTQLLPVIREALTNIARHAGASAASVTLSAGPELVLRISDNGRGLGDVTRMSGLRNMRERAQILDGAFEVTSEPGAGTQLVWRVPLSR